MPASTQNYGIDTSVLVRLLTGHPEPDFQQTVCAIKRLRETEPAAQLVASNQVIGEAYITLQHFYRIEKQEAREAIISLFQSGHVYPLNGKPVVDLLKSNRGAGLIDRLIAQDYANQGCAVLTNDRKMAKLPGARLL